MVHGPPDRVTDPERLAALRRSGALELDDDRGLVRISRLATALLGTPVSLVTLLEEDREVFAAQVGLVEPWASRGETPLTHSFCQHVVADDSPLVVADARRAPRLRHNRAIEDLHVVAYCGVPLRSHDGHVLGSFCVIDSDSRRWTPEEVALVEDLAALAQTELTRQAADGNRALAHDVRSTLHGVVGGARTLARTAGLDGDLRDQLVAVVERQARHLEELLSRMLEGTGSDLEGMGAVDVRQVVDEVVQDYELTGDADVGHQHDGPSHAVAAPTALRRCLTNLIDNALKHGAGPVEVTTSSADGTTRIAVSDQGPGIPPDEQERIFQWGHRASSAPGRGFGLATVRELARAMGGDVVVSSRPGQGATFVLALRTAQAAPSEDDAA